MDKKIGQDTIAKVNEIKAQIYGKNVVSEDVIERNYGYKIIRQQVSAGKNSMIYKCETNKQRTEVYCIIKAYASGKDKVKNILKEETAQIMRFVSGRCQQLVSTYDIFYTNDKIYIMSDWAAKGEVSVNLKSKAIKLNEQIIHDWTSDILSAIGFLHKNAICHRNISPSCLLLTNDNRVKIGILADAVIYVKPDGSLIKQKWPKFSNSGNWNQAPEVAKGKSYDPRRADVWSIGATIFWLISKTHPVNYRSNTKLPKQLERHIASMRDVSSNCQSFIKEVLVFQPSKRLSVDQIAQLEWIAGSKVGGTIPTATKEKTTATTETQIVEQDTGESTGPDESPDEGGNSSSSKKGANRNTPENEHEA